MTAVEFLLSHMWTTDWVNYTREEKLEVIEEAKEMEKEQMSRIYEGLLQNVGTSIKQSDLPTFEQYYNETYGSKGSDDHNEDMLEMVNKDISYWKQNCEENYITTPISVLRYISELEKLVPTSSQTEISDEEIEKGAIDWYEKERPYKPSAIALNTWLNACKWYKEQLKK